MEMFIMNIPEILHYAVVYAILAITWVPLMNFFQSNLVYTSLSSFLLFVFVDQLAHLIILKEKFSIFK